MDFMRPSKSKNLMGRGKLAAATDLPSPFGPMSRAMIRAPRSISFVLGMLSVHPLSHRLGNPVVLHPIPSVRPHSAYRPEQPGHDGNVHLSPLPRLVCSG